MFVRESDSVTFFGDNLVCRENNASFNHMKRHLFSLSRLKFINISLI
jgi:predicted transcriptional regulator